MAASSTVSLAQILGAEIMRVGQWNGNGFTVQDLADMAAAAADVGYTPPLKVGHDESVGARAWGWVRNIRLAGEKLVADLMDIPESLAAIIRERGYDQLSAEVYVNLERDGRRFPRALKAVALLGAEVPAVSNLRPLRELFAGYEAKAVCFTNHAGGAMPETTTTTPPHPPSPPVPPPHPPSPPVPPPHPPSPPVPPPPPDPEVARLREQIAVLQAQNREVKLSSKLEIWKGPPAFRPFFEALYRTSVESPRTLKFSSEPGKTEDLSLEAVVDKLALKLSTDTKWMLGQMSVVGGKDFAEDPGAEVNARAQKLVSEKGMTYQAAVTATLNSDPALKSAYAGV